MNKFCIFNPLCSQAFLFYFYAFLFILILEGNGGNAGHINIRYRKLNGWLTTMSCKGAGAKPANNGQGGPGRRIFSLYP